MKKRVILFFTGFGKFGKILENPTTFLSKALKDLLDKEPIDDVVLYQNHVITVSIEHCDEALNQIYQKINDMIDEEKLSQDGFINHYVVLHMGVYQGSGAFRVEI